MNLPQIVSATEWEQVRDELLAEEKAATHALDALAARRRRLPMVRFDEPYVFTGPDGPTSLIDLFDQRRQLIVYQFMDLGPDHFCGGCSSYTDNIPNLTRLRARDTNYVHISRVPYPQIARAAQRMGWQVPFYSSHGTDFDMDCGLDGGFGLSVFLRDRHDVFRSYFTTARGVDRLRVDFNLLDLTPYGRQESWEDSPDGWPQVPTYSPPPARDEYADHSQREPLR